MMETYISNEEALASERQDLNENRAEFDFASELVGKTILYFGNEWFAENRTSSHHIARRLPEFCKVLYVDSPGLRAPAASSRDIRRLRAKIAETFHKPAPIRDNLWHCTIPQLPFRRFGLVRFINRWFGLWAIRRAMRAIGANSVISWFVVPHPGFLAGKLGEDLIVHYCVDDYAAHPGVDSATISVADAELSRIADLVFVAPPALVATKKECNSASYFSPHGVDFELFSQAMDASTVVPEMARNLRRPVIGYFGSIADWIDVPLLEYLGCNRPDWTFLMIGHVATNVAKLRKLDNFHFVGQKQYEALAGWAKAFDVAIMPYRQNRQVMHANPLKLREYLSTGKPVVAAPNPEIRRFSDLVSIAETPEEFLAGVELALRDDSADKQRARIERVRESSWDARVAETLQRVCVALRERNGQTKSNRISK